MKRGSKSSDRTLFPRSRVSLALVPVPRSVAGAKGTRLKSQRDRGTKGKEPVIPSDKSADEPGSASRIETSTLETRRRKESNKTNKGAEGYFVKGLSFLVSDPRKGGSSGQEHDVHCPHEQSAEKRHEIQSSVLSLLLLPDYWTGSERLMPAD